jgi:hypothetical protein
MNTIRNVLAAVVVSLIVAAPSTQAAGHDFFTIYGIGNAHCSDWLYYKSHKQGALQTSWLLGFLTGMNNQLLRSLDDQSDKNSHTDIGGDALGPPEASAWVDDYCGSHQFALIEQAADALVDALLRRVSGVTSKFSAPLDAPDQPRLSPIPPSRGVDQLVPTR